MPCPECFGTTATLPRSDRPTAPGSGSTTSPSLTPENMSAAWLVGQGPSRKPPSLSLSHPARGPPTVSEADAMGRGRRGDPGTHTALSSPALCPQVLGARSSPSTRPAALCSRARMPASSASSMMGQPPSALSGRLGTRSWRVSRTGCGGCWRWVRMHDDHHWRLGRADPGPKLTV